MNDEQTSTMMREFVQSLAKPDLDKSLSYLADDAIWEAPEGTFKGKDELRRYLGWMATNTPDLRVTETGIGIVVQGDRAAFEHLMQGTVEGATCSWQAMCAYEFAGDKIQKMRTTYDRLAVLNQAASGWLEGPLVHSLIKRAEKGL